MNILKLDRYVLISTPLPCRFRSREKARGKAKETTERVNKLKAENEMLEDRIKLLSKVNTYHTGMG